MIAKLLRLKDKWLWPNVICPAGADQRSAARHVPSLAPVALGSSRAAANRIGARELLDKLFEPLSPEDRLIIRLLDFEDHTAAEVRQLTGWTAIALSARTLRARWRFDKQFRKLLKEGLL